MNTTSYFINGVWYTKHGYFGCQLMSIENGIKEGSIRVILDRIMYVVKVEKFLFRKNTVNWSLIATTKESIQELYDDINKITP